MQTFTITTPLLAVAVWIGLGLGAQAAGPQAPGVRQRQHHQADRIQQGVRSGQLTREETRGLVQEQQELRQQTRDYKADGTLTATERADLHQDLTAASQNIHEQKHDDQTRPRANFGPRAPGVDNRQQNQADRLSQGVRSGELTVPETKRLVAQQTRLAHLEQRLKSDGTLTAGERARLQNELNELSREIYRQKHDTQSR